MTSHGLVLPPTEGEHHGAGDGVVDVGSGRVEPVRVSASTATEKPSLAPPLAHDVPEPFTEDEYDALITSVWSLDNDDPTRFDELLSHALAFIGRIALDGANGLEESRAAELLRAMEQRSLWGPDHPVRQP